MHQELVTVQRARVDVASILRRRIQWGLHLAQFKPGDRLPSLRAAAAEFGVDQRSVLAAYRALQEEGLVELRPRSGVYIAEVHAPPIDVPEERRWMVDVFLKGFSHGVAPSGLAAAITEVVGTRRLVAACVENNGDYLLAMSSQLRRDFGLDTIWVEPETLDAPHGTARLARADLIVTTSFFAHAARAAAREVGRPAVVVA